MKILITGAYGMLGSDLREVLKNHELIATGSKDLDITDENEVIDFISENSPEIVINAAAYTAVDDCETNYDDAYAVYKQQEHVLEVGSFLVHLNSPCPISYLIFSR